MFDLQKRVAVVTGGASGMGAACVAALAREGAVAVSWDVAGTCDVRCDVSDATAVSRAVHETRERFGSPSLLVACAGIALHAPVVDMKVEDWDRVFGVNMRGVMLSTQAVAREIMAAGGKGAMVLIASANGVQADPGLSAYSAAKAGVFHFARVAAREFGPSGIRINAIGPGPTETPMMKGYLSSQDYRDEVIRRTPLGEVGQPEYIAEAVVSLLKLEWVTGQAIMVDGGSSLNTGRGNWDHNKPASRS
jgi:NAD(P)-dependent dehydrogenase (short-subunit alcohol dehydrogenase family)